MGGRIVVVGLGPAGADHVLPAARRALEQIPNRYVRTSRHPAVGDLAAAGLELRSFDDDYDAADDLDEVYDRIAAELLDVAATAGEVVYAVPGNPAVAERSVELLRDAAARGDIVLELVPGLSFAELAWARLGVDPMAGARLADARHLTAEDAVTGGPVLIAQCDTRLLLSDVKLVLLEVLPADAPVTVLRHLGLDDEEVRTVALADLDRDVEPDHLTALLVDSGVSAATRELARLLGLAERLRRPGGCPWDADQTHHSLTRYLLEEAYEVVEAVEALPPDAPAGDVPAGAYRALEDELGDLLYQVIFHAVLAEEAGAFDMAGVARGIHDKLVRRHPHVFGDTDAETSSDVMRNWEQIKKDEKGVTSIVGGHHARAAVAAVRAQADAQGGVGRARPRRTGRRAAAAGRRPRRAPHGRRPGPRDPARRPAGGCDRARPFGRGRRRVGVAGLGGTVSSSIRGDGAPGRGEAARTVGAHAPGSGGALDRVGGRAMSRASSYTIQGQEVTIPVEVRDASAHMASFLVPAARGPGPHRVFGPRGRRAAPGPGGVLARRSCATSTATSARTTSSRWRSSFVTRGWSRRRRSRSRPRLPAASSARSSTNCR